MPMNTATKLLLGLLGGSSAAPITYLFRDEFTTDVAAGNVNGSAGEPGPGNWTALDTSNLISKSGGELVINGKPLSGAGNNGVLSPLFARVAGLSAVWGGTTITTPGYSRLGLHNSIASDPTPTIIVSPTAWDVDGVILPSFGASITGVAIVLFQSKTALFIQQAGIWTLYWMSNKYPATATVGALWWFSEYFTATISAGQVSICQLTVPFDTDTGIATLNVASPVDATEYTGDADGILDLTVTAPGTLDGSASTRCGFYYRADSDLSPAWHAYVDGTGAFNLDSIDAGGTRTNRIAVAGVITGGGTRTLRVIVAGTKHNAYTLSGTTWTKRGSEINVSLNDAVTTIEPSVPAGWTAANLQSWPRTSAAYAELDRV